MSGFGFDPMDDHFFDSPKTELPRTNISELNPLGLIGESGPMVTPTTTPRIASFSTRECSPPEEGFSDEEGEDKPNDAMNDPTTQQESSSSSSSSSGSNLVLNSPLPPEFRVFPRPPPGPPPSGYSSFPMIIPFQLPTFAGTSVFPELSVGMDRKGDDSVKAEPMNMDDSPNFRKNKRPHSLRVVTPSTSYKKEIQRQSALQMQIQNIEQRRKKGTLCLGNFLFGCTADRPKINTIRPFGRCDKCLAGRSVPLQRTRMSKIKQFADEKRQTLIPASHGQLPIRCQRYPNVFGNWALLVFATVQDAENATAILGQINGEPCLVNTSSVLPDGVWANGVPFMRSGKYNKLVPKPIDNTSVVPPTKIMKPNLKPNELSRNMDDISYAEWSTLDQKYQCATLTAEQLASPAEMEDVTDESPRSSRRAFMYSLCDCGAPRCLHRFNPNSWVVLNKNATPDKAPIRWLNFDDLHEDISEEGPHHVIFSFQAFPGRSVETRAYFVQSILSRRFEFRLPLPPSDIMERCQGGVLNANVAFLDANKRIEIDCAPFTFIHPTDTAIAEVSNPFWTPRSTSSSSGSPTAKKEKLDPSVSSSSSASSGGDAMRQW